MRVVAQSTQAWGLSRGRLSTEIINEPAFQMCPGTLICEDNLTSPEALDVLACEGTPVSDPNFRRIRQ